MQRETIEGQWREVDASAGEPDLYVGADDFELIGGKGGSAGRSSSQVLQRANPMALAQRLQTPGLTASATIAVGGMAALGYSLGRSPEQKLAYAAGGALLGGGGLLFAQYMGWVD
ncbi:MAG: hypothetical protein NTZ05_01875 [Chloroflexi bacterium]|nr:hypothetical protein [Chloroflexota bacterium]